MPGRVMKKTKVVMLAALALGVAVIPGAALADQAESEKSFTVCQVDKAVPDGGYEVNNNNFAGKPECLAGERGTPGFRVSVSGASLKSVGSDAYPNIFAGCSWGWCSPHSWLPDKLATLGDPKTTFRSDENASGIWGTGYDMFFSPRPIHDGQAQVESMIWLNAQNTYNPAGHGWPVVHIDGALWWVLSWETSNKKNHWRYVQFRRETPVSGVRNLALGPFIAYLARDGWVTPDWYLLNVEAGFEIWSGGTGLRVTRFAVQRQESGARSLARSPVRSASVPQMRPQASHAERVLRLRAR